MAKQTTAKRFMDSAQELAAKGPGAGPAITEMDERPPLPTLSPEAVTGMVALHHFLADDEERDIFDASDSRNHSQVMPGLNAGRPNAAYDHPLVRSLDLDSET